MKALSVIVPMLRPITIIITGITIMVMMITIMEGRRIITTMKMTMIITILAIAINLILITVVTISVIVIITVQFIPKVKFNKFCKRFLRHFSYVSINNY